MMYVILAYDLKENLRCGIGGLDLFMEDLKRGRIIALSFHSPRRKPPARRVFMQFAQIRIFFLHNFVTFTY